MLRHNKEGIKMKSPMEKLDEYFKKHKPALYLANNLGFTTYGQDHLDNVIVPRLENLGYEVIEPFTRNKPLINKYDGKKLAFEIALDNQKSMDRSEALVAILDGTDVDSGVAAEIGYAYALGGITINGYRNDFRKACIDEGICDINLQVQFFVENSGGRIYNKLDNLVDAIRLNE